MCSSHIGSSRTDRPSSVTGLTSRIARSFYLNARKQRNWPRRAFLLGHSSMLKKTWTWVLATAAVASGFALYPKRAVETRADAAPPANRGPAATSFRIVFGIGDREPARWDGHVDLAGGKITDIAGWRFAAEDGSIAPAGWKVSTRRGLLPVGARNVGQPGPMLDNGVIVSAALEDPNASFSVEAAQGKVTFSAREVPFGGPQAFLDGRERSDHV